MSEIGHRRNDHINAVLKSDVRSRNTTGLETVVFEHVALPELDFEKIDLTCPFLGYTLQAPFLVSSMTGGDKDWSGVLNQIDIAARSLATPVIVKNVGFGISARIAKQLWNVGFKIIDVAGSGGTSWAVVEAARAPSDLTREVAETFRDWGISTAQSIKMIDELQCGIQIIASGVLRTGLEAAQAIRLGASLAGFAAQLLPAAVEGAESLNAAISKLMTELRIAAFCTGSASIAELKRAVILRASAT